MTSKQPNKTITFNFSHIFILGLLPATGLLCTPTILENNAIQQEMRQANAPSREEYRQAQSRINEISKNSAKAMSRIKTGACIPVVDLETGKPVYFSEIVTFEARETRQRLTEGQLVCNIFGETAEVGADGKPRAIAQVPIEDLDDYRTLYTKLSGK